jgi:hypothetical protein
MPRPSQWSLHFGPPNQNPINTSPLPHAYHMSHPSHPLNLVTLTILGEEYRLWSTSLCNFLHDPSSSLLSPNINTLFSKTLSLCSSLKVRDEVSHPYSTNGKITVLHILISQYLRNLKLKSKPVCRTDGCQTHYSLSELLWVKVAWIIRIRNAAWRQSCDNTKINWHQFISLPTFQQLYKTQVTYY